MHVDVKMVLSHNIVVVLSALADRTYSHLYPMPTQTVV